MPESGYRHLLVLADIKGSSGCGSYQTSRFPTRSWARAGLSMSRDVDAVVRALFDAGVPRVTVQGGDEGPTLIIDGFVKSPTSP